MSRGALATIAVIVAVSACGHTPSAAPSGPASPSPGGAGAHPATPHHPSFAPSVPPGPVAMAGCPPLPSAAPPYVAPWHPAVLVPDSRLPAPPPSAPGRPSLAALDGKGMWIWQWRATEGGRAADVVARARAAGLRQLWVRVADSRDRFYAADELAALVPLAHRAGIAVIAWGFPFLYDPVDDAAWTAGVLAWRGPNGEQVDGYSADLEMATEGVELTDLRAAVYLGLVRQAAAGRPVVGTVYPPTDRWWSGGYPYRTIARYVDAFAPMEYWECRQPGDAAAQALARLAPLRPVHLVGEAFSFAGTENGRVPSPSATELARFLDTGHAGGALGASFWVWQLMNVEEWKELSSYGWGTG